MESESAQVWSLYFGRIGSQATERLLERFGQEGSFLLRDSETVQGLYCLCVRKTPLVHTYRLAHTADGWCLQDSGVMLQAFRTVGALIEHYRSGSTSGVTLPPLTHPLDKTRIQCLNHGEDSIYMEMCCSCSSRNSAPDTQDQRR
ncbi:SH2 domain-containing protein 1A-like [Nelusetta ayraudi]|uniref:SH2 domain-containing protein 1A-like n=1 Tax=Nelusetta ayraudi TaxID=303726 RepID=UPI003F6EBF02